VDSGKLWDGLVKSLEGFKGGNTGRPFLSRLLWELMEAAWVAVSVHHEQTRVRSGALVEVILESEPLALETWIEDLKKVSQEALRKDFANVVAGSVEDLPVAARAVARDVTAPKREGETALDLYTENLTGKARAGKIDPIFGRDKEIRQMIDILLRRRKNNPILVGEPGTGKTAVVEGLALRMAAGDVPEVLRNVEILTLDLGLLQAGAGVKGEFESRLKGVIQEVKASATPIILFIDEAHTLIGAGGAAGTSDAANLLKPALARGELRTVAATTWTEYKKYIERDPALERRFQMVKVDEPDVKSATIMIRGIKGKFESHHGVRVTDEAAAAMVSLAARFITGRQLPDKAVDLLDTASARVKLGQTTKPPALQDLERQLEHLDIEITSLERDLNTGLRTDTETVENVKANRQSVDEERGKVETRWQKEQELVQKILEKRRQLAEALTGDDKSKKKADSLRAELDSIQKELSGVQGEEPLITVDVSGSVAAQVVSDWTGIPAGRMVKDEAATLLQLEDRLRERIIGQDAAITAVAETIRSAKAGLRAPEAPLGVFLFVGPSGVGKTECALAIADLLFGGDRFVTTINMSEYQESHTVSQLKGAPPGYVGYGEGGVLTEAVRQRPYSVVILDEVEKAHRDVMNLFYQVFDRGFMRDGEGREIDFKNTIIMMTSNLGSETMMQVVEKYGRVDSEQMSEVIRPELVAHFQPALLARFKFVPFYPLDKEAMVKIVRLKLNRLGKRLRGVHQIELQYGDELLSSIADRCVDPDTGARNIDAIIDRTLLPQVSRELLMRLSEPEMPTSLTLSLAENGQFVYTFA
jgi:type VI secretion system protein VasG